MAEGKFHGVIGGEHPDRFLQHQDAAAFGVLRNGVAVEAQCFIGEPLDEAGGIDDLAFGFRERLALLGGHDDAEVVGIGQHQVRELAQDDAALLGQHGAPGGESAVGGLNGAAGFRGAHGGDFADRLEGGGVLYHDGLAVVGFDPFAVQVIGLAKQRRVLERQGRQRVQHWMILLGRGVNARIGIFDEVVRVGRRWVVAARLIEPRNALIVPRRRRLVY